MKEFLLAIIYIFVPMLFLVTSFFISIQTDNIGFVVGISFIAGLTSQFSTSLLFYTYFERKSKNG